MGKAIGWFAFYGIVILLNIGAILLDIVMDDVAWITLLNGAAAVILLPVLLASWYDIEYERDRRGREI